MSGHSVIRSYKGADVCWPLFMVTLDAYAAVANNYRIYDHANLEIKLQKCGDAVYRVCGLKFHSHTA